MNVISISLWGSDELYIAGALENARLAPTIYPGWTMRAYCSPEVSVLEELRELGVDVRIVEPSPGHGGLFWRFLPAGECEIGHVIMRDADSRLNVRERAAVDAWIASGLPFHAMRDHLHHQLVPLLGGMWGCRGGAIPDIGERIARFSAGAAKHDDTRFLCREIWPIVHERCLVHSSVPEPLGGTAFPPHDPYDGFVGEIVHPPANSADVIALLMPSRGRPAAAAAAARSARRTATTRSLLRIAVGVEPDEVASYREAFGPDAAWVHPLAAGGNYVRAIRELQRSVSAGIYGLCADDFVFETPGWDERIRSAADALPERIGLIHGDDGLQGARIATAPFLTAEWIGEVGDVLPGAYQHMFCDTELTDIARRAGLIEFLPSVKITHRHPLAGLAATDATYERAFGTWPSGRAEFVRRSEERERLARRLAVAAHTPLLSVLVVTRIDRTAALEATLRTLRQQIAALEDSHAVEIVVESDAGESSAAAKRDRLLEKAKGRWAALLRDDDRIEPDALSALIAALQTSPDCVTLRDDSAISPAPSRRLFAVRTSLARAIAREDRDGAEDFRWSAGVARMSISEAHVGHPLFQARGIDASHAVKKPAAKPNAHGRHGLPSAAQEQLLLAALGDPATARSAWSRWTAEVGVASADPSSTRLFPLAWWNLERAGETGLQLNALKPHYWRAWAGNQERIALAVEIAALFEDAGIPSMLLKGAALALAHYEKPALRPMSDVDIMVPAGAAESARDLLRTAGWRPAPALPESAIPLLHGTAYTDGRGRFVDLHWRSLHESPWDDADEGFWQRAESVDAAGGTCVRVLSPADQILHVCVHGLRWARLPAIQWVADVVTVVRSSGDRVAWSVLVEEARARRVVTQAAVALQYVRETFGVSALDGVCAQLAAIRPTLGDRLDFAVRTRRSGVTRDLLLTWLDAQRLERAAPWHARLARFPEYLRAMWGLRSVSGVPATAARKAATRLKRGTRG